MMETRLVRLDREQLDRLREKVTVKPGVVIIGNRPGFMPPTPRGSRRRST